MSTAGHLVDQLERTSYVDRTPDPTDAHARLVRLADRGTAARSAAGSVVAEVEGERRTAPVTGGCSPEKLCL